MGGVLPKNRWRRAGMNAFPASGFNLPLAHPLVGAAATGDYFGFYSLQFEHKPSSRLD
jgi:hypothetical protein